jgi:hypothetical protein
LLRHPEIEIYFIDRANPLRPFEDMYRFTSIHDSRKKIDLRPRRVIFKGKVLDHNVLVEIVLGCRTTTAEKKGEDVWGIDLYGNDRLFVHGEYELFREWYQLPKGNASHFVRGYINILGPNYLIPWDTHKRHLNAEREVMEAIKKDKSIREFFARWRGVYNSLSGAGEIKKTIAQEMDPWKDKDGTDLNIPFSVEVPLGTRRRGEALAQTLPMPSVPASKPSTKPREIKLKFSNAEFKRLCQRFEVEGAPDDRHTRFQLEEAIRIHLLSE